MISSFIIVYTHDYFSTHAINLRNWRKRNKKKYDDKLLRKLGVNFAKYLDYDRKRIEDSSQNRYILIDYFPLPLWTTINAVVAHFIAKNLAVKIEVFSFSRPSMEGNSILKVFQLNNIMLITNNLKNYSLIFKTYRQIKKQIKTLGSVIEISIDGIDLGIDIYESILRRGCATVNVEDHETYIQIYRGIKQYFFFLRKFEEKEILAILLSHDNYIGPGLLSRMAYKYGVPVILANIYGISIPTKSFELYSIFHRYKLIFNAISSADKIKFLQMAKKDLESRTSGKLNIGMAYQIKSAFEKKVLSRQIRDTTNVKVLILTHDFYDNPHGYGRMLFDDFWQWLCFLGELSLRTNYDWYIKCHRDYSAQELIEVERLLERYPMISLVNPETSFIQLRDEGIEYALTCFGSVGHELPFLGITVVNNSNNPHIAYDFNIHASTVGEYENIILNLPKYKMNSFNYSDIYEFFTVHQYLLHKDDYILESFNYLLNYCSGSLESNKLIEYLSENIDEIIFNSEKVALETFKNRRIHPIERVLGEELQQKVQLNDGNKEFFHAFQIKKD